MVTPNQLSPSAISITTLLVFLLSPPLEGQPTKVADKDTHFNRVYIIGNGNDKSEDESLDGDLTELKGKLEQRKNQKSGSDSKIFWTPTKQQIQDFLDGEKRSKQPGEELTFFFAGHGNVDTIRLNATESMSAQELAAALRGFRQSVTVVVILDSCYGGSFADDIGETDHVTVIGPSTICHFDADGIFDGVYETLTEAVANGGGGREADQNNDGIVTAEELKRRLEGKWTLGQPQPGDKVKKGKSKCLDCELPSIVVQPSSASRGTTVRITGERFTPGATVNLNVLGTDLRRLRRSSARADSRGSFTARLQIASVPSMIIANDEQGNEDWHVMSRICDVDVDGDIDQIDIRAITGALETRVDAGSAFDSDGDGRVTTADNRICTQRCSAAGCAKRDPPCRTTATEPR